MGHLGQLMLLFVILAVGVLNCYAAQKVVKNKGINKNSANAEKIKKEMQKPKTISTKKTEAVPTEVILQPVTDAIKNECVNKHNNLRRSTEPLARDMQQMVWNEEAAETAAKWAKTCVWEHSHVQNRTISSSRCGENLYKSIYDFKWSTAIQDWYDENKDFKYGVGTITKNAKTGHYTQIVWSNSTQLGCAKVQCGKSYIGVCHYCPLGNIVNRTAIPYAEGEPCEKCPNKCDDGLCTNGCPYEDLYHNCPELSCYSYVKKCAATCKCKFL